MEISSQRCFTQSAERSRVGRCVECVVHELLNGRGSNVQSCIGGSVVDINAAVLADDGSVSERNVGNVADALDAVGRDEQSGGACDEFGRIVEVGSEYVDDVAQASRSIPYAVGNVYPALGVFIGTAPAPFLTSVMVW